MMPARILFILSVCFIFLPALPAASHAEEDRTRSLTTGDVVLNPADRMILEAINRTNDRIDNLSNELNERIDNLSNKLNERIDNLSNKLNDRIDNLSNELNGRIDRLNERIDNLWITMLGGFMGVMAFIGGLVFWDRRTFLKRAQEAYSDEMSGDRKKIKAMLDGMRKLSEQFPQVREVLKSYGLL